jgi:hypothetical protein
MLLQATRRLCRRGAKKFGVEQSDTQLHIAVEAFLNAARCDLATV